MRKPTWFLIVVLNLVLAAVVVWTSLPYLDLGVDHPFLAEKGPVVDHAVWRAAFYFHVVGALICLCAGPLLLSRWALRRSARLHRVLGTTYVVCALYWAAPSGLLLAFTAKGGPLSSVGFLLLGVLWFWTTLAGYRAIRARRMRAHLIWMSRSYALAHSAISFRVAHLALGLAGVAATPSYVGALWVSVLFSLWLGERLAGTVVRRALSLPAPTSPRTHPGVRPCRPALSRS